MKTLAPVILFVYNRADNTAKTIEHLQRNYLSQDTELYVFSDGGRDDASWQAVNEVRAMLKGVTGFKRVNIIERPCNFYLERNVIEGITEVLSTHDRAIIMEDDICTSPYFLTYMNEALELYKDEERVMHIAGFTNLDVPELGNTYFTPHMSGWGWATWSDRWAKFKHYTSREEALAGLSLYDINRITYDGNFPCLGSLDRNPIPWDICWELAIYRNNGLCLHPTHTLLKNIGLVSGTHFGFKNGKLFGWYEFDRPFSTHKIKVGGIPIEENADIEAQYAIALKDHGMRYNLLGRIARRLYRWAKGKK
mgnify:CR=1 FL=1